MVARSATTGSPAMSLPRMIGSMPLWWAKASEATISLKLTICRSALGSSMPITVRPGIEETRAEIALMLRAMSSARPITRLALMPGAGSSSYMVTTGPVRTAEISPLTLKSSSTVSRRRALRSRLSLSTLGFELAGGSARMSSGGSSYLSNRSFWRLSAPSCAALAGRLGSVISGALRGFSASSGSARSLALAAGAASSRSAAGALPAATGAVAARARRSAPMRPGRVRRRAQSIAKTFPASATPLHRHTSATSTRIHGCATSGANPARPLMTAAPSRPPMPPIEAGRVPPGWVNSSESTVAISTIASASIATGIHQRWSECSISPSSSSTSSHSLRAKT